jgi:hypothetical protein
MLNVNVFENVTNKSGSLILVSVLYEVFSWTSALTFKIRASHI